MSDINNDIITQLQNSLEESENEIIRLKKIMANAEAYGFGHGVLKGLEDAAIVAETFKRKKLGRDFSSATYDPCGRWEGGEIYEEGKEKDLIAKRIRELKQGVE